LSYSARHFALASDDRRDALAYALERHTGKALGPSLIEALFFILGVALVLALPTVTWVMIAGSRLKNYHRTFGQ